jgi:hypothetical protein
MRHPPEIRRLCVAAVVSLAGIASPARATDEIQVYNAEINAPGAWSLQLHGNYVARGRTEAEFPGGLVPDRAFNGTPEFALGLTDAWEVGLYLPYAVTRDGVLEPGGAKIRALVASPHARDRRFFYGLNVEVSHQPRLFEGAHWNSEIRPIVGWRRRPLEVIVNPIVDVPLSGSPRRFDFAPAARLGWILSPAWTVALEHYADFGPIDRFAPTRDRVAEVFAVGDYTGRSVDVDFGVGRGLTAGSDDWTAKFILGWGF